MLSSSEPSCPVINRNLLFILERFVNPRRLATDHWHEGYNPGGKDQWHQGGVELQHGHQVREMLDKLCVEKEGDQTIGKKQDESEEDSVPGIVCVLYGRHGYLVVVIIHIDRRNHNRTVTRITASGRSANHLR